MTEADVKPMSTRTSPPNPVSPSVSPSVSPAVSPAMSPAMSDR